MLQNWLPRCSVGQLRQPRSRAETNVIGQKNRLGMHITANGAETFTPLFDMAKRGLLHTKVEKTYPLAEAHAAIAHASQNKRSGKIVFLLR